MFTIRMTNRKAIFIKETAADRMVGGWIYISIK